jgi:hypothetical protein
MFDNNNDKNGLPPANLPSEPADIFADVEGGKSVNEAAVAPNALKSGMLKPKSQSVLPNPEYSPPAESETIIVQSKKPAKVNTSGLVKIIIGIVGVFGVLALSYGGWFLYQKLRTINSIKFSQPQPIVINKEENKEIVKETVVPTSTGENAVQTPEILFGDGDSDNDGLSDAEEKQYLTKEDNPDTDGDGLSDADEVKIWTTDPLKQDTDGDTFLDGSEIMNGYNAKGAGKFAYSLPIVRFVSSSPSGTSSTFTYTNYIIKAE